jgi:hypothetical protein
MIIIPFKKKKKLNNIFKEIIKITNRRNTENIRHAYFNFLSE